MKRGYHGSCCNNFEVFAISSDAPNLMPIIESSEANNPEINEYFPSGHASSPGSTPFGDGATWGITAAKLPSSYPYSACDKDPPMSSADPGASGQWSADIVTLADVTDVGESEHVYKVKHAHFAMCSRVTCLDGEQRWVTYGVTSNKTGLGDAEPDGVSVLTRGVDDKNYDHVQVNIDTQVATTFSVEWLGQDATFWGTDVDTEGGPTAMQLMFNHVLIVPNTELIFEGFTAPNGDLDGWQHACNCVYYGKEFYFASTYTPEADYVGAGTGWMAARLEYANIPTVYCSDATVGKVVDGTAVCTGPYAIMLPSCRAFLKSSVDQPDEPWVIARSITGDPLVVTGKSHDITTRAIDGFTGEGWDGTLAESEVVTTILPPTGGDYLSDEDFTDPRVRCYNHIDGLDLAIVTCKPADPGDLTRTPLATFGEDGASGVGGDINDGLPPGLFFESEGERGDSWTAEQDGYYTDAPAYEVLDNKWSAKANSSPVFLGQVSLVLRDVHVVNNSSAVSFDPRLDNRAIDEESGEHINNPANDGHGNHDTLEFFIDGVSQWSTYNTAGTTAADFLEFMPTITISGVSAGTHTFRWTLKRATTLAGLAAWIDNVQLPEILVTDDINGVKRYYWDGFRLRRAKFWKFPKRDDEQGTDLTGRVSTVPDFITRDRERRILYGNPHYLCRIHTEDVDNDVYPDGMLDETFGEKGYVRWTASPVTAPPSSFVNQNCEYVDLLQGGYDTVADPRWGAFQILPTKNTIQLRGVNASVLRDATTDPIHRDSYPNEEFVYQAIVPSGGQWNSRVSCWTLRDDGKTRVPHVEVIWRPTYDQPAFPVGPDYAYQPWPIGMEYDSSVLRDDVATNVTNGNTSLAEPGFARIRDPRAFPQKASGDPDTRKPVWNGTCRIVPRNYSDTYSRRPQFYWARVVTDDPDPATGDDPGYYDPPWPSVRWRLVFGRHCPTQSHGIADSSEYGLAGHSAGCANCQSDDSEADNYDPDCDADNFHYTWNVMIGNMVGGFTDFDAVDCDCDCCVENDFVPPT